MRKSPHIGCAQARLATPRHWPGGQANARHQATAVGPTSCFLRPKKVVFTRKIAPFYVQITANLHQTRTLTTLRDTLLPKLLSGEQSTQT